MNSKNKPISIQKIIKEKKPYRTTTAQ